MSSSASTDPALVSAGVRFRDERRAALNWKRISARAPKAVLDALPNLLVETPDPDAALNGFERLVEVADVPLLRSLDQHPTLVYYALTVSSYSQFLGDTLVRNLDLFPALLREKGFHRSHHDDEFRESLARFRARAMVNDVSSLLAQFKRREYIRIMLRDVLGIATLAETTAEISALADVMIGEALREAQHIMRNRYGAPHARDEQGRWAEPSIAVLSLGKLGGGELNYSSDVDLLFIYQDAAEEEAAPGGISNREYFIRLAQQVTELLSRSTPEGPVFRIDLRLRPQGREGEPAVGLQQALRYYRTVAHDWELQAMIKARHTAGDPALSRTLLHELEPLIYRGEANFAAIETAMNSLQKISRQHRSRTIDVKTDRGGIRDIEFLVQCLQRVYGGNEPWLRSGGTLFSIHKLHDKGHLSGKDFHDLGIAYEFLRRLEHRLQLRMGQQTHRLPESRDEAATLWRLTFGGSSLAARATEAAAGEPEDPAAEIVRLVRERMQAVAEIYNRIVHQQHYVQELASAAAEKQPADFHLQASNESGSEPSFQQMLTRLAADEPQLYEVARRDLSPNARRNLQRFLSSAFTSSERYAAVAANPAALQRALTLFENSEFLTELLVRHPEEILSLGAAPPSSTGAPELFAPELQTVESAGSASLVDLIAHTSISHGEKLALLRQFYRHRIFLAGTADVERQRSVYESLHDATAAAFDVIRAAFVLADAPDGFAVLGLGRLGTGEHDLSSDADVLFVCADETERAAATRAAEQLMQALAAYTRDGTVFSVDSRLRPHGMEGELVVTPAQLATYFAGEAQAWEALTYTKLRPVAGAHDVAHQAVGAVIRSLSRFASDPGFADAVRTMRTRLERVDPGGVTARAVPRTPDIAGNFKIAPGGFYDIDFIASFLLVRSAAAGPGSAGESWFPRGNIRDTLAGLGRAGALAQPDCEALDRSAELLRATEHIVRLVQGRARKSLPTAAHARATTERMVAQALRREFPDGLEPELRHTAQQVRELFNRLVR
jgi:[glutamine synthetase] adenylyltransferase / [glutamine synthetase]-adenylyl-L-tyrosine phosphorylase